MTTEGVVLALVGAALGIPVGVVIGRWVWHAFAVRLGVAPEPALPVLVLGVVAASVGALAVAIAVLPGRWAARARPGVVLQAE